MTVQVYLNGQPRTVQRTYGEDWRSARASLGVRQGEAVGLESDREPTDLIGAVFEEGDRYVILDATEALDSIAMRFEGTDPADRWKL